MKWLLYIVVVAFVMDLPGDNTNLVFAGRGSSPHSSKSAGKSVHVSGYTRKNGTSVKPYTRSAPGTASHSTSTSHSSSSTSSSHRASSTSNRPSTAYHSSPHYARSQSRASRTRTSYYSFPAYAGARDANGRLARSDSAKHAFMRQTGYSHGRPGYVVDHIIPLKRGGADSPSNMQWQTVSDAKAKDKWE
jgi:hypothetical protein